MIVRGPRPERDFTILDNTTLREKALTWKARGLLGFILSQPPGYEVNVSALVEAGPEGREAVRTGLIEIEKAGYLRRTRVRHPDGTFTWQSVVHDRPEIDSPQSENLNMVPPAPLPKAAGQTRNRKSVDGKPDFNRRTDLEGLTTSATASPLAESADRIARAEWERRDPKPVGGKFPGFRSRILEQLEAGRSEMDLTLMLPSMTTFTRDAFDYAAGRFGAAPSVSPNGFAFGQPAPTYQPPPEPIDFEYTTDANGTTYARPLRADRELSSP